MTGGNERTISGGRITIPFGLMHLEGIELENGMDCNWCLFPKTEAEWRRILQEHPRALVMFPAPAEAESSDH